MVDIGHPSAHGLEQHGLKNLGNVYWNLSPAELIEQVVCRDEALLVEGGAIAATTGKHTGRSPNDKFIVQHADIDREQIWWGNINQPIAPVRFNRLLAKMQAYLQGRDVFVQDLAAGAHPDYRLPIRVITETAWHSQFAQDLFIRPALEERIDQVPGFTVLQASGLQADPQHDGTRSSTAIIIDFKKHVILIAGSAYAGEIKKSIFSVMNYLLPQKNVMTMHCAANLGQDGDVALFFGLSGTGKTTLSSDPDRQLIGDDEHGWSDEGVFNFEGGCYAKTIRLRPDLEPIIWDASQRFGSVLENVVFKADSRVPDFDCDRLTENTRAAYPIEFVPNHVESGYAGHPRNIFFLTADAFGVMPPIARLTPEQAMYYFLSGYTSKLAGTERGLGAEPQATFSTCFASPFLPLHPSIYADMLGERITRNQARVWLVNTGWTGGPYGVGQRIRLPYTRAMIKAALNGDLDQVPYRSDGWFGIEIPTRCPGVPDAVLDPMQTWSDTSAYAAQVTRLIAGFERNFAQFADQVDDRIASAGPREKARYP